MRRREFIGFLSGAVVAGPIVISAPAAALRTAKALSLNTFHRSPRRQLIEWGGYCCGAWVGNGTFPTSRDVRLESGMRAKADAGGTGWSRWARQRDFLCVGNVDRL